MIKIILIILVLAAGAILAYAAMQPDSFRYERSTVINAPASDIFPQVNNLRNMDAWSPWAKLDPNAKSIHEGPEEGVGATVRWDGNRKVGAGSMTITESRPNEMVRMQLDFLRPMKGTSIAEFTLEPIEGGTRITWSMYGPVNYIGKIMSVFMNCEKMVGAQFEEGLSSMKSLVEQGSAGR